MTRWLAEFDAVRMEANLDLALMLTEARNRVDHLDNGEPLKTRAELKLEYLQHEADRRELARRADAGDRAAIKQLVRERAELELLIEEAKARNAEQERQLRASVADGPAYAISAGSHWCPPGSE